METQHLGELCALLTAISWAVAMVLFKRCGETITPVALNLFKNTLGLVLLSLTLLGLSLFAGGQGLGMLAHRSGAELAILLLSGFLGIAVADTLFLRSLNIVGVGIQSIVDCVYSPFVILLSWVFLAERLSAGDYLGGGCIISAVYLASQHRPPTGRSHLQLTAGILLGVLAIALMAVGIVMVKPILDPQKNDFPLLWATTIRLFAGTIPLAFWALRAPHRRPVVRAFTPHADWKYLLPASFIAAYICMVLWIAGFKYAQTGVAAVLNQTSTIVALVLATVWLKERFSIRKLLAVILAMSGVCLVAFQ